uniref:Uncharacterized protein n=1 Tax=Solanum tuberosum TaxID=4113 RepID=M1BLN5_SOLTU
MLEAHPKHLWQKTVNTKQVTQYTINISPPQQHLSQPIGLLPATSAQSALITYLRPAQI